MGYASFGLVKFEYDDDYDDDFLYTETQRHGVLFFVQHRITSLRSVTHFLCSLMYVHKTFRCFSVIFVLSRMH